MFPDGSYIYCQWADIQPTTVYDKGIWKAHEGLVELKSDREVTWDPRIDRKFVAFHRHSRSKEILIIGLEHDLPYFEKEAGDDPGFMLLLVAKKRETTFSRAIKEELHERSLSEFLQDFPSVRDAC